MHIIDEEISDILSAHGERILAATLKVMAIAATLCLGVYLCSGWIPAIQASTLPLVVGKAAVRGPSSRRERCRCHTRRLDGNHDATPRSGSFTAVAALWHFLVSMQTGE
jgi:hypothetical protein